LLLEERRRRDTEKFCLSLDCGNEGVDDVLDCLLDGASMLTSSKTATAMKLKMMCGFADTENFVLILRTCCRGLSKAATTVMMVVVVTFCLCSSLELRAGYLAIFAEDSNDEDLESPLLGKVIAF
jgi:hypothetical protein